MMIMFPGKFSALTRSTANRDAWVFSSVCFVLVLCIASLAYTAFDQEKKHYQERSAATGRHVAQLLEQEIGSVFDRADVSMRVCAYQYAHLPSRSRAAMRSMTDFLARQKTLQPELDSLGLMDSQGTVLYGQGANTSVLRSVMTQDRALSGAGQDHATHILPEPIYAPAHHQWLIVLVQRVDSLDRRQEGFVFAGIDVRYFSQILSLAALGRSGAATMRTHDLQLISRYPFLSQAIGTPRVSDSLRDAIRRYPGEGEYLATTLLDGIERSNAYRRIPHTPFYIIVGLASRDDLGALKFEALIISLLAFMASLITLVLARRLYSTQSTLKMEVVARTRLGDELVQAFAEKSGLYSELAEKTDELAAMNASLEKLVASRTEKLTQANLELEYLARHDVMTGLCSRMFALERMDSEFRRFKGEGAVYAVLLIDIDLFKRVNDNHGHEAGDCVLIHISGVMAKSVRSTDFVARFGGEEFLIILADTRLEEGVLVAEKIRAAVEDCPLRPYGPVTLSIGVAMAHPDHVDKEDIVRQADQALYHAKELGRNRVCAYALDGDFLIWPGA